MGSVWDRRVEAMGSVWDRRVEAMGSVWGRRVEAMGSVWDRRVEAREEIVQLFCRGERGPAAWRPSACTRVLGRRLTAAMAAPAIDGDA